MSIIIPLFVVGTPLVVSVFYFFDKKIDKKTQFINNFKLPESVVEDFFASHPSLSRYSFYRIECAFKQYIGLQLLLRNKKISKVNELILPSSLVNDLWYSFSQHSEYPHYCNKIFGKIIPFYNNLKPKHSLNEKHCFEKTYHYIYELEKYRLGYKEKNIPLLFKIDEVNGILYENVQKFVNAKVKIQLSYIPPKVKEEVVEQEEDIIKQISIIEAVDLIEDVGDIVGSFFDD